MNNEKTGTIGKIFGVLYKPRSVFSTVTEEDLTKGILIMLGMVISAGYSSMVYLNKLPLSVLAPQLEGTGTDLEGMGGMIGIFAAIGGGISLLIGWTISTLLMHGVGKLTGGEGTMKRFFAIHGFATVPGLLNQLLRVIDASIIDSNTLSGYYLSTASMGKIVTAILGSGLGNIWGIATLVLVMFGIQENYGAGKTKALLIALLPNALIFALTYFMS